ncbi:hypothetical protein C8J57DRAFT_1518551 [Mycena rebaudengoi]|nr:hypothetical protein C8J57DRAFT_1518514 [Mycena rebaudengoi]KAJ7254929.1 hypothetical protein C8J57DRAFT_1518551 [Mycena rebaudengoi]
MSPQMASEGSGTPSVPISSSSTASTASSSSPSAAPHSSPSTPSSFQILPTLPRTLRNPAALFFLDDTAGRTSRSPTARPPPLRCVDTADRASLPEAE